MRIAICLHGISDGKDPIHQVNHNYIEIQAKNFKEQFKNHQLDIFVHTWNESSRDAINQYMKPTRMKVEPINDETRGIVLNHDPFKKDIPYKIFCKYSRFYSMYQSNQLRVEYEKEHNFEYDLVIHLRFIFKFHHIDLNGLDLSKIYSLRFASNISNYWTITKPVDWILMGNSSNMSKMASSWLLLDEIFYDSDKNFIYGPSSHTVLIKTLHYYKLVELLVFPPNNKMMAELLPKYSKPRKK